MLLEQNHVCDNKKTGYCILPVRHFLKLIFKLLKKMFRRCNVLYKLCNFTKKFNKNYKFILRQINVFCIGISTAHLAFSTAKIQTVTRDLCMVSELI